VKKINALSILCLVALLVSSPVFAQEKESWTPSGFFSFSLQEKYIGFNLPEVFHEEPVLWSELFINLPSGFYVDFWHSIGLDDSDFSSNWGDEFDICTGWKKDFDDFSLDFYTSLYNVHPIEDWWSGDFIQFTGLISKEIDLDSESHSLTAGVKICWVACLDEFEEGAVVVNPFISHVWDKPFDIECFEFNQKLKTLWNSGFINTESDDLSFMYSANFNWQLKENLTLTAPGVTLLLPLTNAHGYRDFDKSISVTLNFSF